MGFPEKPFKPKRDNRSQRRGGQIKFLYISCAKCHEPFMVYQKDGPGGLIRCYFDRIVWPDKLVGINAANAKTAPLLKCAACGVIAGTPMTYLPEDRPAYRIVRGSVHTYRRPPDSER